MTAPEPDPRLHPWTPELPAAFYINGFKQRVLAVMCSLASALFLRGASRGGGEAPVEMLWLVGGVFLAAAVTLWLRAGDRRPLLVVREEGLRDRVFGDIPWEDVRRYRLQRSLLSPGFGYDLKPGVLPPRNTVLWRWLALVNRASGLPQRVFRRQMMVGGLEPMLLACRAARPDLEA
jgi:hypothetical protein